MVLYGAILCCTVLYYAVQCCTVEPGFHCGESSQWPLLHRNAATRDLNVLCCTILYCTVFIMLYCTVL